MGSRPPGRFGHRCLLIMMVLLALIASLLSLPANASPASYPTPMPDIVRRQDDPTSTEDILPTGVTTIDGQPPPTSSPDSDPLLAIMPDFCFSMPAQIIVDGITLALVSVLSIQLIFTAQYHFPLSRKNYSLQLVSSLMLLVSLAVHLHVVLNKLRDQSHVWPYMFPYIGVQIPPEDGTWTIVQETFYLLMRAVSTALVHLTNIQFLTLLFPSALEARLILWMLGPLALVASGMEFTALSSENDVKTSDLGDAIRNICNSALFLLYTAALLIWGVLVNRGRAWRTDGGTAAFGGGSVGLAIINTTISFVGVAYDRLWWLPDICWTLTVWQSWLGFWWWVGSGMGIGEVEDRAERQERRRKKEEKLKRKRAREERNRQKALLGSYGPSGVAAAASSTLSENSDALFGQMRRLKQRFTTGQGTLNRRAKNQGKDEGTTEDIELERISDPQHIPLTSVAVDDNHGDEVRTVAASSSDTQPTTSGGATSSTGWMNTISDFVATHQPDFIKRRMRRLRLAHVAAAQKAATEQSVLRDQVLNRQSAPQAPGLRTMISENRSGPMQSGHQSENFLRLPTPTIDSSLSSAMGQEHFSLPFLDRVGSSSMTSDAAHSTFSNPSTPMESSMPLQAARAQHNDEWVDEEEEEEVAQTNAQHGPGSEQEEITTSVDAASQYNPSPQTTSWSWRGGLRTLRMRDRTTYD